MTTAIIWICVVYTLMYIYTYIYEHTRFAYVAFRRRFAVQRNSFRESRNEWFIERSVAQSMLKELFRASCSTLPYIEHDRAVILWQCCVLSMLEQWYRVHCTTVQCFEHARAMVSSESYGGTVFRTCSRCFDGPSSHKRRHNWFVKFFRRKQSLRRVICIGKLYAQA